MAMSIHQTSLYVGIVASGFIAAYIGEHFGWRMSFFTFGLGGLLLCIYLFFRMEDTPQEVKEEERYSIGYVIKEIFKKKTVWMLCLAFGGMCFVNIGYVTWMSTFYHESIIYLFRRLGLPLCFFILQPHCLGF